MIKYSKVYIIVFGLLFLTFLKGQDPDFSATIKCAGGTLGIQYNLTFGFSPSATDTSDVGIDIFAPPAPPPPMFDAALTWAGDRFYTQILNGSADDLIEHEYGISLAYDIDNMISITWDTTGWFGMMSSARLQDAFGGLLGIDVDMLTDTSLVLTNPNINTLKLLITPKVFVQQNEIPIANAGPDTTGRSGTWIFLYGSGFDPDADPFNTSPVSFSWTTDSLDVSIDDATDSTALFFGPAIDVDSEPIPYSFILTVTDVEGAFATDTVIIRILPPVPTANAGQDQIVTEGNEVDLNGAGTASLAGEDYYFHWEVPAGIELSDTTAENPRFIAPLVENDTDYSFILIVEDGVSPSASAPDTVVITVKNNQPPIAVAKVRTWVGYQENDYLYVDSTGVYERQEVKLTDGDYYEYANNDTIPDKTRDSTKVTFTYGPLIYHWSAPEGIVLSDTATAKPTFIAPDVTQSTDLEFVLVVNDGDPNTDDSNLDTVIVTINDNQAPVAYFSYDTEVDENIVVEGEEVTLDWHFAQNGESEYDTEHSYDLNNDQLSILWQAPENITLSTYTAGQPRFYAPAVTDEEGTLPLTVTLILNDGLLSDTAEVIIPVLNNDKPIADAGSDKEENEDITVVLNGSDSHDPTDVSTVLGPLNYAWTAPGSIMLSDVAASNPTFTAPVVTETTNFDFGLVVFDGEEHSVEDIVVVTVIGNQAPEAHAGADQTFYVANSNLPEDLVVTVELDGSGSTDNNEDELSYLWTIEQGEGITLSDSSVSKPTFIIPDTVEVDTFEFMLKVTDEHGLFDISDSTVAIFVAQNYSATADAGDDQEVDQGIEITLDGQGSDDTTNVSNLFGSLTYNWTTPSGIVLSSSTAKSPTFTSPDEIDTTSYIFYLVVNDGELSSSPDSVTITVFPNKPPSVNAGSDQEVDQGTIVTLDGLGSSDPNNDILKFTWELYSSPLDSVVVDTTINGVPIKEARPALSGTELAKPTFTAPDREEISYYVFLLTVNDGFVDSEADHVRHDSPAKVIITVQKNKPPVAVAGSDKRAYKGNSVILSGTESTDINFDPIAFEWSKITGDTSIYFSDKSTPEFQLSNNISSNTIFKFTLVVKDTNEMMVSLASESDTVLVYAIVDSIDSPSVPSVYVTAESRKVIVSWDASAEKSIDPFSDYSDFEGYKVYKSTDGGTTWGGPQNKIYDYYGNFVGWNPIAQFDYTELQDESRCVDKNDFNNCSKGVRGIEISGLDPMNPRFNLGTKIIRTPEPYTIGHNIMGNPC